MHDGAHVTDGSAAVRAARRWPWWLLLVAGALGATYCGLGVIMAADFSVACDVQRPQDCAYWHSVAIVYEWLVLGCLAAGVAAAVMLVRVRAARRRAAAGVRVA